MTHLGIPSVAISGAYWFDFLTEPPTRGVLVIRRSSRAPVLLQGVPRYVSWGPQDEIVRAAVQDLPAKLLHRTLADMDKADRQALLAWLRAMARLHGMRVVAKQVGQPVDAQCVWARLIELVDGGAS